jgi:uncharacterized protein (TIGR02266 family)
MSSPLALALQTYAETACAPPADQRLHAEQRASERVRLEVEVTLESDHNFYTGLTSDLSEGGLFVATHALWPVGTKISVRFRLPGLEQPIQADTEVRWVRDGRFSTLPPGIGLRFFHLPGDALHAVTQFVQRRDTIFYEE